jgi:hypothetical protein
VLIVLKSGSINLLEPSGPVKVCNGTALPLLTMVLSIEKRVLVEYVFREGNRYTNLVQQQFAKSAVYRDHPQLFT